MEVESRRQYRTAPLFAMVLTRGGCGMGLNNKQDFHIYSFSHQQVEINIRHIIYDLSIIWPPAQQKLIRSQNSQTLSTQNPPPHKLGQLPTMEVVHSRQPTLPAATSFHLGSNGANPPVHFHVPTCIRENTPMCQKCANKQTHCCVLHCIADAIMHNNSTCSIHPFS